MWIYFLSLFYPKLPSIYSDTVAGPQLMPKPMCYKSLEKKNTAKSMKWLDLFSLTFSVFFMVESQGEPCHALFSLAAFQWGRTWALPRYIRRTAYWQVIRREGHCWRFKNTKYHKNMKDTVISIVRNVVRWPSVVPQFSQLPWFTIKTGHQCLNEENDLIKDILVLKVEKRKTKNTDC